MADDTITTEALPAHDVARLGRRLREQMERSEAQLVELESVLTDMVRGNDTIQEDQDTARRMVDAIRDDVRHIRGALTRVANGTYGLCAICGTAIPLERLEAIPTVAHCARCA
jgi:RNA polymerase-binding transcription factor DksA